MLSCGVPPGASPHTIRAGHRDRGVLSRPMSQPHQSHYRRALLFTGHMVDLPSRPRPRFPPRMETAAAHEIAAAMDRKLEHVDVGHVVAISSLARGGDILFQEHAAGRRLACYIVLPFE